MVVLFAIVIGVGLLIAWLVLDHWIVRLLMLLPLALFLGIVGDLMIQANGGTGPVGGLIGAVAAFVITWMPKWYREAKSKDASLSMSLRD
jgi:hypothetical protein